MQAATDKQILDTIARYREGILDFAQELIAIPTENPPGTSYRACVGVIERKLREIGLDCTVIEVPDYVEPYPRYCLLGFHGEGERTLYFHGHYDVVPATGAGQFRPRVEDGKLFGRGSADMKGGLAAMIYAVKAIRDSGIALDGRIGLTIVPDEETGGARGTQYLAQTALLGENGIGMLLPEPTGGVIWNAHRGAISLRLRVKGKPAHVALHHEGVNAFEQALAVANALLALKLEVETRETGYHIKPEAARRSILMMGGQCRGGTSFNLVPAECSFTIDRRINPEEDLEVEKQRLLELFERLRGEGIDLEVDVLQEGESAGVPEDDAVAQALSASIQTVKGEPPAFELCPGLLETRFYVRHGIPAFAYGPGLLEVSHGPHESIEIEGIYDCAAIYALTAVRLLVS
jgi:succinyl-diaminopimelate desuccinylase